MSRPSLHALVLALATVGPAQAPALHASEVAAWHHARAWIAAGGMAQPSSSPFVLGYDGIVFGTTTAGAPIVERARGSWRDSQLAPNTMAVLVLRPIRDSWQPCRPLFVTHTGRMFVGTPPPGSSPWQPTIESLAARGAPATLPNLLLDSGTAQDGTVWLRVPSLESPRPHEQALRLKTGGRGLPGPVQVRIGAPRLPWHPAWLPLPPGFTSLQAEAGPDRGTPGDYVARGEGVPADGLRLSVACGSGQLVLTDAMLQREASGLVVDVQAASWVEAATLQDQAWVAHALRLLAEYQVLARAEATIDRDGDGRGEFGSPEQVLPPSLRSAAQRVAAGRYRFRNHTIAVRVPEAPDDAEREFTASAWPETGRGDTDLVFVVDASAVVHCAAAARVGFRDGVPEVPTTATTDGVFRPLR